MKDFSFISLYAITHDMLGMWFWPAVIAGAVIALAFLLALLRQRGFRGAAARRAIVIGTAGAIAAMAIAPFATQASFANLHGAADMVTLALIGLGALIGVAVTAYAAIGLGRPA
ncbi:DUF5368 family protein [Pseudorhodoplanes sp.]|uniref:DUF5368 family protein n=1 Tax=Pseudorhodoplanes sp. TaxID=1934341 RepID=UPI00391D618C